MLLVDRASTQVKTVTLVQQAICRPGVDPSNMDASTLVHQRQMPEALICGSTDAHGVAIIPTMPRWHTKDAQGCCWLMLEIAICLGLLYA